MAIYHFEAKMISRGTGRSVVAAAAYASCSRLYNDYDGVAHDYTKKHGNIYSEIFLPSNAPPEWKDRNKLWNAVEAAEKSKDSRLARELVVALTIELEPDDWKSMLKDFIKEECTDKGMCADVNIHDTDGHNPHAHILLTVRPLDDKGKWQAKTQKEYLCKRGDEERGFTATEFKAAQSNGWEKQYQYRVDKKKVYMTSSEAEQQGYERVSKNPKSTRYGRQNPICAEWNSEEQILQWRKAWENVINNALERKSLVERVDCRSFAECGIDEQPTIHEGVTARIIEQHGGISERCEINRQIRKDNAILREIKEEIKKLVALVKNTVSFIANTLETLRNKIVFRTYELEHNENLIAEITHDNRVIDVTLNEYNKTVKRIGDKTKELKNLKSEQKNLSPIHFLRHRELSEQITKLQAGIKNQKDLKAVFLDRMGCKSEKDVPKYKALHTKNDEWLKNISAQNVELIQQKQADKVEFLEIRNSITNDDMEAVQEERYNIREGYMTKLSRQIRDKYGNDYNYIMLKDAESDVNHELNEKPLSLKRKIQRNQQLSTSQEHSHWRRNCEQER